MVILSVWPSTVRLVPDRFERMRLISDLCNDLGVVLDCFFVSEYSVWNTLKHLKVNKSSCDELLTNRLLVELADVLAAPVCALINSSMRHGRVRDEWKIARVTPKPKISSPLYF
jgi:hypothetical protein